MKRYDFDGTAYLSPAPSKGQLRQRLRRGAKLPPADINTEPTCDQEFSYPLSFSNDVTPKRKIVQLQNQKSKKLQAQEPLSISQGTDPIPNKYQYPGIPASNNNNQAFQQP